MFCYQCQEASKGIGCTVKGVCGKTEDVANIQDLTIYLLKGISILNRKAVNFGITNKNVNKVIIEGLFSTITNANFDKDAFEKRIKEALVLREEIKNSIIAAGHSLGDQLHDSETWTADTIEEFEKKALLVNILDIEANEDIRSLKELVIYGLKGMAAYAEHAFNLKAESDPIYDFIQKALEETTRKDITVGELVPLVLETGKYGVDVMAMLDEAHTTTYGNPEITKVNIGVKNNPAILISGHDLKDMEELLKQTDGTGVDVYTHSEMLPAHYYPAFKKYTHFVGNYGSAWWNQTKEFETFNGPIVFTTNCLVPPKKESGYFNRVFTTGATGYPGFKHIGERSEDGMKDFSEVIAMAKTCASPTEIETGEIIGGFAHNQVMQLADKVVDAVKTGAIRKFFVMAGCDGRMKGRDYYTEFAQKLPQDTVILTAGCAKYRYNKLELGDIGGIPRVLDAGQCNDSYSLAVIALKLKEVFELNDINELPIAYNIAWYEQKAVIVLLALLHLGVKNIHLGPTLPAFLSPNVVNVLVENFGIAGIGEVDDDLKLFLGSEA
ncbi:MAG: hydroxylamine reductase [Bacteroidales bacterium]|nr:hydroxylamine reductase [Bacteroidales bacterium]